MEIRFSSSFLSVHAHVCVCKLTWWGRLSQLKHSHSKWLCLQILSLRPPVINHWSTVLHVASDHNWSSHTLMSVCTRHWRNYPLTDALIPLTSQQAAAFPKLDLVFMVWTRFVLGLDWCLNHAKWKCIKMMLDFVCVLILSVAVIDVL